MFKEVFDFTLHSQPISFGLTLGLEQIHFVIFSKEHSLHNQTKCRKDIQQQAKQYTNFLHL